MAAAPKKKRPPVKGKTFGVYYGEEDLGRFEAVQKNAERFRLHPSDYGRRVIEIGQRVVLENPSILLEV